MLTVLGTAGIGKSRLLEEFVASLPDEAQVVFGRCLSYGDGVGLWPLQELLRSPGGLEGLEKDKTVGIRFSELLADEPDGERAADRLTGLAGLGGTAPSAEEVPWAVRHWAEAIGRQRPLVMVIDDLHWADPLLIDVIEELTDWVRDAAVLVICLARPEFLDDQPQWGGGKLNSATMMLENLSDDEAQLLVENVLRTDGVSDRLRQRVIDASVGNPLFLEQMLATVVADGVPYEVDELVVPPSIGVLLSARLDRLSATERFVLEAASVVGQISLSVP